jgi:DNA/RNA endonuclease YhcR with UshA esterase domain
MKDKQLLHIAMAVALLGLVALFVLAENVEVDMVPVDSITDEFVGQRVTVQGSVFDVRVMDDLTMFHVQGHNSVGSILVVIFDIVSLIEGDRVVVSGTVKDYKGTIEIVGEKVDVG